MQFNDISLFLGWLLGLCCVLCMGIICTDVLFQTLNYYKIKQKKEKYILIKLHIEELLKQKGKSKYWLANQMDIAYQNLANVLKQQTSSISFKYINDFCKVLECSPGDLMTYEPDGEKEMV